MCEPAFARTFMCDVLAQIKSIFMMSMTDYAPRMSLKDRRVLDAIVNKDEIE